MGLINPIEAYPVKVIIGERGSGKTVYSIGNGPKGIPGAVIEHCQRYGIENVMVIDTVENREDYAHMKTIFHPRQFISGKVRLIVTPDNKDECIRYIMKHVRNCFLLFEDARNIVPKSMSYTAFEALVINSKNIQCTCWFMYHGFSAVAQALFMYLDEIVLFRTKNHPKCRKPDIANYEEVLDAYEKVMRSRIPFHHINIKTGA